MNSPVSVWLVSVTATPPFSSRARASRCRAEPSADRSLAVTFPCRRVVRETDADRVELPEPGEPLGVRAVRLASERELERVPLPRVVRGEVERLAAEDDAALRRLDHEGLMARRMPGRRDDADPRERPRLPPHLVERRSRGGPPRPRVHVGG